MSLLKKLFGGGTASGATKASKYDAEDYKGFTITPTPMKESGGYRLSARIEKDVNGEAKTETLIRADTFNSADDAAAAAVNKAKLLIDQMGDNLFTGRG